MDLNTSFPLTTRLSCSKIGCLSTCTVSLAHKSEGIWSVAKFSFSVTSGFSNLFKFRYLLLSFDMDLWQYCAKFWRRIIFSYQFGWYIFGASILTIHSKTPTCIRLKWLLKCWSSSKYANRLLCALSHIPLLGTYSAYHFKDSTLA